MKEQNTNLYQSPDAEIEVYQQPVSYRFVGFWMRVVALIVDFILLFILLMIVLLPIVFIFIPDQSLTVTTLSPIILSIIYTYFWYYKGGTPGKLLMNAKIINLKTGDKLTFLQCLIRCILFIATSSIFPLLYVIVAFTDKKQGLHDFLANTAVVYLDATPDDEIALTLDGRHPYENYQSNENELNESKPNRKE